MRREWTIWLAFIALVVVAMVFVVRRDHDSSKLSAGTSVPTTVRRPLTTVTTRPLPPTTPPATPTSSPPTTVAATVAPTTTRPRAATPTASPGTVATTQPPATAPPPTAPLPTAPPPTDPPLKPAFGDGFYRINIDLPPGTYRSEGGSSCTWDRLSTQTYPPSPADVIASGYSIGSPITVVIAATDGAFQTSGCQVWLGQ